MCWVVCLCAANAGKQGSGIGHARFYSGSHFAVIRVYGEAGNVIETHEHAGARSVDNDDDARWLAQCLHRSFGSSVDVNPRFLGVVAARYSCRARIAVRELGLASVQAVDGASL